MTIDLTDERWTGTAAPVTEPSTAAPLTVPGYEILGELGRGGNAVVYRARQATFDRMVALKVLTRLDLVGDLRRRFQRECQALGLLSWHPNIVRVYDAGLTPEGDWYLAMEYLAGGSLCDRMHAHGPRPWAEVLDIGVRIADALDAAHREGLLHRDVKPGNVLLDCFGECKLADFGVVAVRGEIETISGVVTGTVAHAAPEVLGGDKASVASDVYSLGSTMYELLAGSPAFVRDTDETFLPVALRAWSEPAPDLRASGVPDLVADVIAWAMTKDPSGRPADAAELAAMLQENQQSLGVPVTARRLSPLHDATDKVRSTPPFGSAPTSAPITFGVTSGLTSGVTSAVTSRLDTTRARRSALPAAGRAGRAGRPRLGRTLAVLALSLTVGALTLVLAPTGSPGSTIAAPDSVSPAAVSSAPRTLGPSPDAPAAGVGTRGDLDEPNAMPPNDPSPRSVPGESGLALIETVPVGSRPSGLAAAGDSVWATITDEGRLVRIDVSTHELAGSVFVGGSPGPVVTTADAVWVGDPATETVVRVDVLTMRVTDRISVGRGGVGLALVDGAVWVALSGDGAIARIDPRTRTVTDTIAVGTAPVGLVGEQGAVWVIDRASDSLRRVDLRTGRAGRAIAVGSGPAAIVSSGDALWVTNANATTVTRYDLEAGSVSDTIELGGRPTSLAATRDGVWTISERTDQTLDGSPTVSLWRIDPATITATAVIDLPTRSAALAITDLDAWVAVAGGDAVQRVALPA